MLFKQNLANIKPKMSNFINLIYFAY